MKFKKPEDRMLDAGGPNLYVKVKAGVPVTFTPCGEIYEFFSVFGTRGPVLPSTPGARIRYKMNVATSDDGGRSFKMLILEFGKSIYDQLYEISQVCDVTATKLRLSRKGTTREDTEYTLLPMIKEPLSPSMLNLIEGLELNTLDKVAAPQEYNPDTPEDKEWRGF